MNLEDISEGQRVWVDYGGDMLDSGYVADIDGETVTVTDERFGDGFETVTYTVHHTNVWPDRLAAIRDGAAHPDDWHVTSSKKKYWDAYYSREE